ncbi:uncharacterized protein LOC127859834 isoform X3 [Dreissena polymorpha]|uniref:uncharacterized protein LOC127859834 isoform X3 n=1 Tax=Dreissena polymorpha TaxID=45954 RepID=UPI0022652D6A|nr:uncharacterized protein LOC127859834 isoform X3 [Dreissena polymorpha]
MYETVQDEYDKLRKSCKANPGDPKLQTQLSEKERTLRILEAQIKNLPGLENLGNRDTQLHNMPSINVDEVDYSSPIGQPSKERKHQKHSSSPGAMFGAAEPPQQKGVNVCRSKSDVSTRKNALSEYMFGAPTYKRTESSPEVSQSVEQSVMQSVTPSVMTVPKKVKKSSSFKGFRRTNAKKIKTPTASVPHTVSDLGTDSTGTSPRSSPTPVNSLNTDPDQEEDYSLRLGMMRPVSTLGTPAGAIIGVEDDDFQSDEEMFSNSPKRWSTPLSSPFMLFKHHHHSDQMGDTKIFNDLATLVTHPAHMAVFLHYVITQHNPAPVLFYEMTRFYNTTQGNSKDLKKWAYEIHSTFIIHMAPLKVTVIPDWVIEEIDKNLQFRSEKEEALRSLFDKAREATVDTVQKLLDDLRQAKEKGLVEGCSELKDHMDKGEENKIVDRLLVQDLDNSLQHEEDEKHVAQSWALATFLRHTGHSKHGNTLEKTPSFVSKDRTRGPVITIRGKSKKSVKGHNFSPVHLNKQELCLHCNKVLWGVGPQGFQCTACDQCVHKNCIDDLAELCMKKKNRTSVISKSSSKIPPATQVIPDPEHGAHQGSPGPHPLVATLPGPTDSDLIALKEQGHSVNKLVKRFDKGSPDQEPPKFIKPHPPPKPDFMPTHTRKNAIAFPGQGRQRTSKNTQSSLSLSSGLDLARAKKNSDDVKRSESMKGREDQRPRVAKRSVSDLAMDDQTVKSLTTGSSSTSSLRSNESPSSSMDTLTAQIQTDSDFEVEPELPSLKQLLGEDTVRKLKPKEKKRQDVINELFYTEKCHVRSLKILDKLFYQPMKHENSIQKDFCQLLFPNLETMIQLHGTLNKSMKERRKEKSVITVVGDLLLQRFDGTAGENFKHGCGVFCRNQTNALESLKVYKNKNQKFSQLLTDAENNPLCQRLALKDIIPKQFMRLTKYPLLIENLMKYTQTNTDEYNHLELALRCSKRILEHVNQEVKVCENKQRLVELNKRIDKRAIDNSAEANDIRELDIRQHTLIKEGSCTWIINNRKSIEVHIVLLERAMVLLQKQEDRLVLKLQNTQLVPGRNEINKKQSPLLWLNNVLARNDATDKKAFFVVNTSKSGPQIYKLLATSAEEQKSWTKHITQASDAMKRSEINKSKAPIMEQMTPIETSTERQIEAEQTALELQNIDNGTIILPEDVHYHGPVISTAEQIISPIDKLRQNEENLAAILDERQALIGEILNIPIAMEPEQIQEVINNANSNPLQLIAAGYHISNPIFELMKETPVTSCESGERIESVEDLTLPIPMDKLRDMANRMNQILTNLLAALNSQNEERDRLRRELKFAQEELNRLRRIQRIQMEAERPGGVDTTSDTVPARPASLVSEASTVSDSEEIKTDSEQNDDQETVYAEVSEDNMPGLPIEPEVTSDITPLNETSPGALDSLVDAESSLDLEEQGLTEDYKFDETETEQFDEELREVEPPDEDHLEDSDTQEVEFDVDSDNASDNEDDTEEDKEETENKPKSDEEKPDEDVDEEEVNVDAGKADAKFEDSKDSDGVNERLHGDLENAPGENCESESVSDRRSSGEVYQDALDDNGKVVNEKNVELTEDPGGSSVDPVKGNADKDDLNDNFIGDTKDGVKSKLEENISGDILNNDKDFTDPSNNNINKAAEIKQPLGTIPSADGSVTNANKANSEEVSN